MEQKSNVYFFLGFIVVIVFFGGGFYLGRWIFNKSNVSDNEPTEKVVLEKEEDKKEESEESPSECSCEANTECCSISKKNYKEEFIAITSTEGNLESDEVDLVGIRRTYKVKYSKKGKESIIKINGKVLFQEQYAVDFIFVVEDYIVIQYYDESDEARLKTRMYYNYDLELVATIKGISPDVGLFEKNYEYMEIGDICTQNQYKEIKRYKVIVSYDSVDTEYVRTDQEYSCAGMT